MENPQTRSHQPILSRDRSNSTIWVGHLHPNDHDHVAGQTFLAPSTGFLNNIQLQMNLVQHPGELVLSFYAFDPSAQQWGALLAESRLNVAAPDGGQWISFELPPVSLQGGTVYGFRLQTPDAMLGLGENISGSASPFPGREWNAESSSEPGHFLSYFSLAFRLGMQN